MLQEIQVNKEERMVYAMDENYDVIAKFPCSTAYYAGYNEWGQPYCNAENGTYGEGVYAEAPGIDNNDPPYGWGYLDLGAKDGRGHALHGGGSNLGEDYNLPFQPLLPTLGCFRLYNADIYWICLMWNEAKAKGGSPVITVV